MTADEVIFLLLNLKKKLAWINAFILDLKRLFFCLQMGKGLADNKTFIKRRDKKEVIRLDDHRLSCRN